jgi:hypothetical protein
MKKISQSKINYYHSNKIKTQTYLEFGSINLKDNKKIVYDYRIDQEAYDFFMVGRYANELIAYRDLIILFKHKKFKMLKAKFIKEIHTKDFLNSLLTWMAIIFLDDNKMKTNFFEIGFTLFGCIETHELCRLILKKGPNVKKIKYSGTEISYFISELAISLHKEYKVTYKLTDKKANYSNALFFAKGVTLLYSMQTINDFIRAMSSSKIAIFDYNYSLSSDNQHIISRVGKNMVYLDIYKISDKLKKIKKKLMIRTSDMIYDNKIKTLRCYCLIGKKNILEQYLVQADKNLSIARKNLPNYLHKHLLNDYNHVPSQDYTCIDKLNFI